MPVKSYNPTSPGRRFQTTSTFDEVTRSTPDEGPVVAADHDLGGTARDPEHQRVEQQRQTVVVAG